MAKGAWLQSWLLAALHEEQGNGMKLDNFRSLERTGNKALDSIYTAIVGVETRKWFKKDFVQRGIRRSYFGDWYFIDTGEYVPDEIKALERAYRAQNNMSAHD